MHIGKYEILETLAETEFSQLFRAYDDDLGREVAIKRLTTGRVYQGEAKKMGQLSDAPVVDVLYKDEDGEGRSYFVMAYLPNGTVADLLHRSGRLSPWVVRPILERITQAISAAHALNIVHCDLKPANILFDDKNEVFVGDFGIATRIGEIGKGGTLQYLSPEQWLKQSVTPCTDVYQCGILLFELLTGELPFAESLKEAHCTGPIPSVEQWLPARWNIFFATALAKNPDDRYQSMTALYEAFCTVMNDAAEAVEEPSHVESSISLPDREGNKLTAFIATQLGQLEVNNPPVHEVWLAAGWWGMMSVWGLFFGRMAWLPALLAIPSTLLLIVSIKMFQERIAMHEQSKPTLTRWQICNSLLLFFTAGSIFLWLDAGWVLLLIASLSGSAFALFWRRYVWQLSIVWTLCTTFVIWAYSPI